MMEDIQSAPLFTVSRLTLGLRDLLGTVFSDIRVTGEISGFSVAHSGHAYFSLKDENAQLSGVIWRYVSRRDMQEYRDGMEVICRGRLEVHPPRGTYQLIVSEIQQKGIGSLEIAFRELKQRLGAEGLFLSEHKKKIPRVIRKVGVVTSPSGAAIHDFLEVLRRRWQGVDILLCPVPVQGSGASEKIAEGIRLLNRLAPAYAPDCLVVTRGGGSVEDLWAFNEEPVVRAVYESEIPVISAVGHEIDISLCDLAADLRAVTPSEAAEIISPDMTEIRRSVQTLKMRLGNALRNRVDVLSQHLKMLENRPCFRFPERKVEEYMLKLDAMYRRMDLAYQRQFTQSERRMQLLAGQLETLSPLSVLSRGYSVTQKLDEQNHPDGILTSTEELHEGDLILTRFFHGDVISKVM